ncbi:MAG: hypothetical protein PVJ84_17190 [Desulfobacteraceae bacterium]|jgi:hypothetical protein
MESPGQPKDKVQLIWAAALISMGIAVFFRIPQVMPKLVELGYSATTVGFIRICFYVIGLLLIGGGVKKVMHYFKTE